MPDEPRPPTPPRRPGDAPACGCARFDTATEQRITAALVRSVLRADAYDSSPMIDSAESAMIGPVTEAVDGYLAQAQADVLGPDPDMPPSLDRWPGMGLWRALVQRWILPAVELVFGEAFTAAARGSVLQVQNAQAAYMATATDRLSNLVWPNQVFESIRTSLAAGIDNAESIPELRERVIAATGPDTSAFNAERVARTESHAAVEAGTHEASVAWMAETGEELFHMWLSARDARVRATHRDANGQVQPLGSPFEVGGALLPYPGFAGGPPETVINCRCSTLTGTSDELADLLSAVLGDAMPEELATLAEPAAPAPVYWRGVLAPLDVRGDYRILKSPDDGEVPTADHMWLSWQESSSEGHDGKVSVGRIDRVWVQDGQLMGEGTFDMADETGVAPMVARKVADGYAGTVSIDQTDFVAATFEEGFFDRDDRPVDPPEDPDMLAAALDRGDIRQLLTISDWRLGGATLVQDPAFATSRGDKGSAFITVYDPGSLTAAATGETDLPIADRDREWDGPAALRRLQDADELDDGTFWRAPDADDDSNVQADFRLPFADIIDGTLTAVPRGIFAVASVLEGGMGGVDIPEADKDAIRNRVSVYYRRMAQMWDDPDLVAPWDRDNETSQAAALAAGGNRVKKSWAEEVAERTPVAPPREWFTNPKLTGVTKVRVTDEGRVFGHIAPWDVRHIGYLSKAQYTPRDPHGGTYPRFHRQPVRCADGSRVNTGPLTTAGHADTSGTMSAAMAHYDDPRYVVANVVAGEDEFGIWVAGALRPGVEPWQVAFADTYSFSGDWRFDELVGACAVSVEGFFVPNDDSVHALAASAGVVPEAARYRVVVDEGRHAVVQAAGVIRPDGPGRPANRAMMAAMRVSHRELSEQIRGLSAEVYATVRRALADDRRDAAAFAQMAEAVRQPSMAERADRDELDRMAAAVSATAALVASREV